MPIGIIVPRMPVSVNQAYANTSGAGRGRHLTPDAKGLKQVVAALALTKARKPLTGKLFVVISYFFPDNRRRDVTNYDKLVLDALEGIAYKDDSQIVGFFATKATTKQSRLAEGPHFMITIYEVENEDDQRHLVGELQAKVYLVTEPSAVITLMSKSDEGEGEPAESGDNTLGSAGILGKDRGSAGRFRDVSAAPCEPN